MARTAEQILRDVIGAQTIQLAQLQSQIETLNEKLAALEAERAK